MTSYWSPSGLTAAQASALALIVNGATAPMISRPNLANAPNCPDGAAAWIYGAWVQLVAANDLASHNLAIVTVVGFNNANQGEHLQIGLGLVATPPTPMIDLDWTQGAVNIHHVFTFFPHFQIPANSGIAIRGASQAGGENFKVSMMFVPRPES